MRLTLSLPLAVFFSAVAALADGVAADEAATGTDGVAADEAATGTDGVAAAEAGPRYARVAVPVADLRREPSPPSPQLVHDPLEESQLLYADPVEILEEKGDWARVVALTQSEWSHSQRWEGYPGWMQRRSLTPDPGDWNPNLVVTAKQGRVRESPAPDSSIRFVLSLGTQLVGTRAEEGWELRLLDGTTGWIRALEVTPLEWLSKLEEDPTQLRGRLVETARLFLGDPYYWGGRSAHRPDHIGPPHTAVDCSGLVGLVYQAIGMVIPRDAHEQWMQAKPIGPEALAPGDLVFLADPDRPDRMSHVMLYIGENRIIEGPGTGEQVREIDLTKRLAEAKRRQAAYGTYLP